MGTNKDVLSIMLATDIHLGVHEKDGIRADDSFIAFEEILRISKERDVDFILLGGDLFHDNKPSTQCLLKCLSLLRKYCMGEKDIQVKFLSDQITVFKNSVFPTVNYEDPNFSISIPVFSIHGNHDDPSGFGRMSALDLLSVCGFVNYFGKWTDLNQVKVNPLILRKGSTKLAIYGLSHIKDDRLFRLMKHDEVEYVLPENVEDYFNLMVLHQNRVDRPGTHHIPESLLPSFINLVFWGHEHDCRVTPEYNQDKGFLVTQPGSSVATSLSEGEALEKNVAILEIKGTEFKLKPVPLKTVRPFVFDSVKLSDWNMRLGNKPSDKIQEYVDRYIRSTLLEKANDLLTGDPNQPKLPLIRLRIEYEQDDESFNVIRFGQTFSGVVANPSDMILMKKKMSDKRQPRKNVKPDDLPDDDAHSFQDINQAVPELMQQYFNGIPEKSQMKVLSRVSMAEAVSRFINKDDKEALDDIVHYQMKKAKSFLEKENADPEEIKTLVDKYREIKINGVNESTEVEEVNSFLDSDKRHERESSSSTGCITTVDLSDEEDAFGPDTSSMNNTTSTTKGRGRGATGRGTRASNRRGRGRAARSSDANRTNTLDTFVTSVNSSRRTTSRTSSNRSRVLESPDEDEDSFQSFADTTSSLKSPKNKRMKFSYSNE